MRSLTYSSPSRTRACLPRSSSCSGASARSLPRPASPGVTPIHITETGWPTDDQRTEKAQAEVLAAVAAAVVASDVGVQACEWFGLRDGRTTATWSARFGVLRDDYTRKPAFATLQHLIANQAAHS